MTRAERKKLRKGFIAIVYIELVREIDKKIISIQSAEKMAIPKVIREMKRLLDRPIPKDSIPYYASMNTRIACRLVREYRHCLKK